MRWRELWTAWADEEMGGLAELFVGVLLMPITLSLWGVDWMSLFVVGPGLRTLPAGPVVAVTLGVLMSGGVLLEEFVSVRSPPRGDQGPMERAIRIVVASVPWVGLPILVGQDRLRAERPAAVNDGWTDPAVVPGRVRGGTRSLRHGIAGRVLHRLDRMVVWPLMILMVQTIVLGVFCLWLAAPGHLSSRRWGCNLAIAVCLHLIGLLAAWRRSASDVARAPASGWGRWRCLAARGCWLLPWPFPLAGAVSWLRAGPESYSGEAFGKPPGRGLSRLATVVGWRSVGLTASLVGGSRGRGLRALDVPRVDLADGAILRIKAALLLLDGMALSGAVMTIGLYGSSYLPVAKGLALGAVVLAAVSWAGSLVLAAIRVLSAEVGRLFGRNGDVGLAAQLVLPWCALAIGLAVGFLISVGRGAEAGLVMAVLAMLLVFLIGIRHGLGCVIRSMAVVPAHWFPGALWVCAALAGSLMGGMMMAWPVARAQLIVALRLLWIVVPILHPMLGAAQLSAVMTPLPPRRALDVSAPGLVRRAGAFVILAAMAPFGGLLLPLALDLRRRCWSEAQVWWSRSRAPDRSADRDDGAGGRAVQMLLWDGSGERS